MTKGAKVSKQIGIIALACAAVIVVVAVIIYLKPPQPPPAPSSSLAQTLAGYKAEPSQGLPPGLVPGAVLRPDNMSVVAMPAEAFEKPEGLSAKWIKVMDKGDFEDSVAATASAAIDILAYLGLGEARQKFVAERVASIITTLESLERADLTEAQIDNAMLNKGTLEKLKDSPGLVIVQTVFRAKSMKTAYRGKAGASIEGKLPVPQLPGTLQSGSESSTGQAMQFSDAVIAYKPQFRGGGSGSDLTPESAAALAKELNEKGFEAKAVGNQLRVVTNKATAPQLAKLTAAAIDHDVKVKLNAQQLEIQRSLAERQRLMEHMAVFKSPG